jgi:hypothetical protein
MVEVCFSTSVKGALHLAQRGFQGYHAGAVGIITDEKISRKERKRLEDKIRAEAEERAKNALPLSGEPRKVLGLSFGLSMGDIQAPMEGDCPRRALIRDWLTADPWGDLERAEEAAEEFWRESRKDLEEFSALAGKEKVRLWVDPNPDSICGLLFAAGILEKAGGEASAVFLPPWEERPDGTVVQHRGWGEVHSEELGRYSQRETSLSPAVLRAMASRWRQLQEENAPLRGVVNGRILSVSEDFYDPFLLREAARQGETTVGKLLGGALGDLPGVGDFLLAQRVRALLGAGKLRLVREEPGRFYGSVVALS